MSCKEDGHDTWQAVVVGTSQEMLLAVVLSVFRLSSGRKGKVKATPSTDTITSDKCPKVRVAYPLTKKLDDGSFELTMTKFTVKVIVETPSIVAEFAFEKQIFNKDGTISFRTDAPTGRSISKA